MNTVKKPPMNLVKEAPMAEFVIAALILLILEAFLFYHFFTGPQVTAATAARAELAGRQSALDDYRRVKLGAVNLDDELTDLRLKIEDAERILPPALHNEDISIMIGEYSREYNIEVESVAFQERRLVDALEYMMAPGGAVESGVGGDSVGTNALIGANTLTGTNAPTGANAFADEHTAVDIYMDADAGLSAVDSAQQSGRAATPSGDVETRELLSVQSVQVSFSSEFHTAGLFIKAFEDSGRKVLVKSASLTRVQEGELKGVLNLEFASLSPDAEQRYPGVNEAGAFGGGDVKDSLFNKYNGFIEDNADPTILLLSEEDDIDPDFYIVIKASSSSEMKVSYGVYPRVETELRSNVNSAVRAKLTIGGDGDQYDYVYSLGSYEKSEKRKLAATDDKLRLKVISCQRLGDNDNVAILLDIENNTDLPFDIVIVNDDVLAPRVNIGITKGEVNVVSR